MIGCVLSQLGRVIYRLVRAIRVVLVGEFHVGRKGGKLRHSSMKIAFVVSSFPCMSETFILKQITGLLDRGHDVEILAVMQGDYLNVHPEIAEYNLLDKTFYRVLIPNNLFVRVMLGLWYFIKNIYKNPVALIRSLNIFKYGRKAASLHQFYEVISFVGCNPYDIIHCHFGFNGLFGLRLQETGAIRGKLITTFHGIDVATYPQLHGEGVYEDLFRAGGLYTYNSKATQEKLIRLNCPVDRMLKLQMGVDLEACCFLERKIGPGDSINILSVGRLVEMKGREYAIRAAAKVIKQYQHVHYMIVGDGPLREELQALICELEVADNISLLGWMSADRLSCLYKSSHIFLHPSVVSADGNMEGQGVVLCEAQACGMPVLATWHNAFPETVVDGQTAFLVPEKDVDALEERLRYLVEQPEIWPEMGRAGRKHVERHYDIHKLNDRLVEVYQEFLSPRVA